jgi:hypothetical protein
MRYLRRMLEATRTKARGKGRTENRKTVFLPPRSAKEGEDEPPEVRPGGTPKI